MTKENDDCAKKYPTENNTNYKILSLLCLYPAKKTQIFVYYFSYHFWILLVFSSFTLLHKNPPYMKLKLYLP